MEIRPYDSALPDGYSGYAVRHDPARYREGDAGDYKDPATWVDGSGERHYAKHVLLTVHNRPDGDVGKITVTKLFASIDGKSWRRSTAHTPLRFTNRRMQPEPRSRLRP